MNVSVNVAQKKGSQVEPLDTVDAKLIGHMIKIRDEIVRMVNLRFPIKGLDMVVQQAFDSALAKNSDILWSTLNLETRHSSSRDGMLEETVTSVSNPSQNFDLHSELYSRMRQTLSKIVEYSEGSSKISMIQPDVEFDAGKDEEINIRVIEDYQKRINKLMLAVKARDRKILEQKREIKKLKNSLESLENQTCSPFIYDSTSDPQEKIQIEKQMGSLMEFMRKITPILNKDQKYKIIFFLKRVGKADINKLKSELKIPKSKLNTLIKELETMGIVTRIEDTILLRDVH
ncbi:MAG: MarR family transcriptional regulator [Candidatus Jordarchaeum sp.]|uniref:MarR family transcriptional regulator n=1 Tax=Candidatus Jordarchaeum sp. TaxID=2823881 RepID=UPI00404B4BB3